MVAAAAVDDQQQATNAVPTDSTLVVERFRDGHATSLGAASGLVAGLVALVAATVWGTKLGVQFSITFLALKALPVLIIGGFTSVPGAIVGGLIARTITVSWPGPKETCTCRPT